MRRPSLWHGALLGGLTSLPVIALFFLGAAFAGLPFLPFDAFDWLARVLPGDVITLGIDAIVRTINALRLGSTSTAAKAIEQLMALAMMVGVGVAMGVTIAAGLRRGRTNGRQIGALLGLAAFALAFVIEAQLGFGGDPLLGAAWIGFVLVTWGALLGSWLASPALATPGETGVVDEARRAALTRMAGGSLAVALGAWGLGRALGNQTSTSGASQPLANRAATTPQAQPPQATPGQTAPATPLPQATAQATTRDRVPPVPGTRSEITENDDFYRIDINTRPVVIQEADWTLDVAGLFENPQTLTLADLMARPAVTQTITIGCISNRVGGDLIGTSNWTGARLRDLLAEWGLKPQAMMLRIEGADGFYENVSMEDMMDPRTLLVYGMNGETLPVEHGFPLRIYIANRYGMKQPKWITRIEAVTEAEPGYWVVRGWSREARPQIVSVIDTIARNQESNGVVLVGGIAWAGDRGIQKVEVQVDDGEWAEATLRVPTLSPLTWVQWRWEWPATPGNHTLRVRATDGTGTLQTERVQGVRPDGATGYHERSTRV